MALPPKKNGGGGLSLYADLLEPDKSKSSSATISSAPVKYDVKSTSAGEEAAAKKKDDSRVLRAKPAALKFQPIKRPQVPQKTKPKTSSTSSSVAQGSSSSSAHKFSSSTVTASVSASSPEKHLQSNPHSTPAQQPSVQQTNFSDWVGGDNDNDDKYYYQDARPKAERGGKRGKKKKNKAQERVWDWDDIYDPTLPNSYAEYKGSEEQAREIRDWKARLYYRQLREARKVGRESEDDEGARARPVMSSMFAPPSNLNFAPPSFDDGVGRSRMEEDDEDDYYPPSHFSSNDRGAKSYDAPPSFALAAAAAAAAPDDATGEDAYMRRMRMSGMASSDSPAPQQPQPPPPVAELAPTPSPAAKASDADIDARRADAAAKIAAFKAKIAGQAPKPPTPQATHPAPPPETQQPLLPPPPPPAPEEQSQEPANTISRAPVRYNIPPPPTNIASDEATDTNNQDLSPPQPEPTRSSRPGQKGFAERLMQRYGWSKGQGLGADGSGITTAIVAKAEKRKKRPDSEGGGWAAPANMGKLVGGKKRKLDPSSIGGQEEQPEEAEVAMSEVVKFEGMLDNLDVAREIEEKNLMQEIGEEMGRQYGTVERVFIWREEVGGGNEVFVKFTSPASAVRAVQGMQGAEFAGNVVRAGFWGVDRFERGEYA